MRDRLEFVLHILKFFFAAGALGVLVYMIWIIPMLPVISEYSPPLINGVRADIDAVDIIDDRSFINTRYYYLQRDCPMRVAQSVECESGYSITLKEASAGAGVDVKKFLPARRYPIRLPDDVPLNKQCSFHIQLISRCGLVEGTQQLTPIKFRLRVVRGRFGAPS